MSLLIGLIVVIICFGGGLMFFGAILLFLSTIYDRVSSKNKLSYHKQLKFIDFFSKMTQIGLLLFLLGIAVMLFHMMVEGLMKGKYELSFNRIGRGFTRITWENQPKWFIFQTTLFGGFSIGILIWILKIRKKLF